MSKYDPLFQFLKHSTGKVELQFVDVEELLGFQLPASARKYAAWWSNSGGTHVQSAAWQAAGYKTEQVDLEQQTVGFVRDSMGFGEKKQKPLEDAPNMPLVPSSDKKATYRHPAWGAMKGMITLLPDVDLAAPSYEDWKGLYGEDK
jgi:hypothetical protein